MLVNEGAFEGKTHLSKEAVHQMTTKQTGPLVKDLYGLGIGASADGQNFGHGGATGPAWPAITDRFACSSFNTAATGPPAVIQPKPSMWGPASCAPKLRRPSPLQPRLRRSAARFLPRLDGTRGGRMRNALPLPSSPRPESNNERLKRPQIAGLLRHIFRA